MKNKFKPISCELSDELKDYLDFIEYIELMFMEHINHVLMIPNEYLENQ